MTDCDVATHLELIITNGTLLKTVTAIASNGIIRVHWDPQATNGVLRFYSLYAP